MRDTLASGALGALAGALLWLLARPIGPVDAAAAGLVFLVANTFVCLDTIDLLVRLHLIHSRDGAAPGLPAAGAPSPLPPELRRAHLQRYAVLLSVRNLGDAVHDLMASLEPHREHVWIVDDRSSDHTPQRLRHAGWRCLGSDRNRKKPGAIRRLLRELPAQVETIVVLDPDCAIRDGGRALWSSLEQCLYDFHRSGAAAFCPSIGVRTSGLLGRLQEFEYALSLRVGRRSLADLSVVSGVSIYRRAALEAALDAHSRSVYAEDLENSLILLARGERIYFDDRLHVDTDAKESLASWFSQRVGWSFGLAKVYAERFHEVLVIARRGPSAAYHYLVYAGLFNILLLPLRLAAVIVVLASLLNGLDGLLGLSVFPDRVWSDPTVFADVFGKYLAFVVVVSFVALPKGRRLALMPTVATCFLIYEMLQAVAFAVGFANWLAMRFLGTRIYRDHYDDAPRLGRRHRADAVAGEPA